MELATAYLNPTPQLNHRCEAGTRQQTLADRHGISLSSVKRLLRSAS
ncbi:hypothetical protein [Glycomyces sp. NPDC048151]